VLNAGGVPGWVLAVAGILAAAAATVLLAAAADSWLRQHVAPCDGSCRPHTAVQEVLKRLQPALGVLGGGLLAQVTGHEPYRNEGWLPH
jgi:hypothetical protein